MPRQPRNPYNGAWKRVRVEIMERDGWRCVLCGERATNVDHIIPLNEAPHLRLEPSNLRATCDAHNYGRPIKRYMEMARVNRSTAKVRKW